MKVLFTFGGKTSKLHRDKDGISFYIKEQADELRKMGVEIDYFRFKLNNKFDIFHRIKALKKKLKNNNYDLIHAHFGLFGFASLFAKGRLPLVTTFHGSDINLKKNRVFSAVAIKYSSISIFVSKALYNNAPIKPKENFRILPCGVDQSIFFSIDKTKARNLLGYNIEGNYILFPSRRDNLIKNFQLAENALKLLNSKYILIELKEKSRGEVNLIMNACDLLLLTSKSEGSPQVIKEALSTNLPIVSVDVGDVSENISAINYCYIATNDALDLANKIELIFLDGKRRSNGYTISKKFGNKIIAKEILNTYHSMINKKVN